ncbi:FG-GAP-like repeat-containing protein [Actinacidiphila bryophytorum]|uniref:FG-GAP-like repeat-containing protein n=1 Tax=Actinacidiphila bryophytorum TaxID=1436133 RepID=UPI00360967C6
MLRDARCRGGTDAGGGTVRRIMSRWVAAAGAGALLGVLPAVAGPAQAATGMSACPSGYLCAWSGANGAGSMVKSTTTMANVYAKSYWNRTGKYSCSSSLPLGSPGSVYSMGAIGEKIGGFAGEYTAVRSIKIVVTQRECNYAPYPYWQSSPAPRSSGFGDLNGDRAADILVRDTAGRLWFLPGNTRGTLVGAGWNAMTAMVRHGDLTGDGKEDLLARDGAGKLWLYPGNGSGGFVARRLAGAGWNVMTALTSPGDLSGDGKVDLLARDGAGKLWLYPGNGRGGFGARKLVGAGWNAMAAFISVGDTTGDGRSDLLTVTNSQYRSQNPQTPGGAGQQISYAANGRGSLYGPTWVDNSWFGLHGVS